MPRLPHLLLLLLCALALAAGAAPALAADAPARAVVATDEDAWSDDIVCADEDGEPLPEEECAEDEDYLCDDEWEDWSDDELASDDEWGDEESFDEWADDEEDLGDDECAEEEAEPAPPRLSALRATPGRRSGVKVSFRLDRKGAVTLSLRRVRGARSSGKRRGAAPRGSVSVAGRRGANATTLRRWKGRALQPGSYRLTATPADGSAATTTFTLRAGR